MHYLCGPQSRGGAWPSPVTAPVLGTGDRRFESCRPDYKSRSQCERLFCARERKLAFKRTANKNNRKPAQQAAAFVGFLPLTRILSPSTASGEKSCRPDYKSRSHQWAVFLCARAKASFTLTNHGPWFAGEFLSNPLLQDPKDETLQRWLHSPCGQNCRDTVCS